MSEVYQRFILCVCSKSVLQSHLLCLAVLGKLVFIYLYSVLLTVLCYTGLVLQHITNRLYRGYRVHKHSQWRHSTFTINDGFHSDFVYYLKWDMHNVLLIFFNLTLVLTKAQLGFCLPLLPSCYFLVFLRPKQLGCQKMNYPIITVCWFQSKDYLYHI